MKKEFYISAILFVFCFALISVVYADSSGPNNPAAAIDDASIGTEVWNDPENVTSSDDLKAAVRVDDFEISHYIKATDFGFSIPSDAIIKGVIVEIERRVSSNTSGSIVKDASVKLVKEGVISGEDRATGTSYTNVDIVKTHGSASDLWGLNLSFADMNDEGFGAAVAVTKANDAGGSREARIDNIRITVHFSIPEEANATITLLKQVVNDNDGTAEADDFELEIDGIDVEQGVPIEISANESHFIDEENVEGYVFANITGDEKCPDSLGENFTLDEGENITCIITNDDAIVESDLREIKMNILGDLIELRNNASAEHDQRRLGMAIRSLNKSLQPEFWIDSLHLSEHGEEAFKKERKAVKELQNTMKSKKSLLNDVQLEDFINRILDVDRKLALVAIEDAEEAEGEEKFIKKANDQIELGDEAASEGRFRGAVNHYLQAWEFAVKAMELIR